MQTKPCSLSFPCPLGQDKSAHLGTQGLCHQSLPNAALPGPHAWGWTSLEPWLWTGGRSASPRTHSSSLRKAERVAEGTMWPSGDEEQFSSESEARSDNTPLGSFPFLGHRSMGSSQP
jgi:hypothetical protein